MKSFVSVNAKYFKHTNATGVFGHINRSFAQNKNAFPEFTKYNFGARSDPMERYSKIHAKREEVCGRKTRKDANTFIDAVVIFSLEQWEYLESIKTPEELQKAMSKMTINFMNEIHEKLGFYPISYSYHLDEGHIKNELVRNVHAHVQFYNFDFKKKKAPLRKLKKADFSLFQDIAGNAFRYAGYKRGIRKDLTTKKHLEKNEFIVKKQKQLEREMIIKKFEIEQANTRLAELKRNFSTLIDEFRTNISKFVHNILKKRSDKLLNDIKNIQRTIDNPVDEGVSDSMVEHSNKVANQLNVSHTFQRRRKRKYKPKFDD